MEHIQTYIESGILEAYVSGSLSDAEMQEVDRMAKEHPEIQQELEEIEAALNQFAPMANGPMLPSFAAVMAGIRSEATPPSSPSVPEFIPHTTQTDTVAAPLPSAERRFPWLLAAAVSLLLVSVAAGLWLFQEVNELKGQVAVLTDAKDSMAEELDKVLNERDYVTQQYMVTTANPVVVPAQDIQHPANMSVSMNGLNNNPDSEVKLFWNTNTKDVYIKIENLPEPPKGHQYQLWAIINNVSIDAGIFDHHLKPQRLKNIEGNVSAFAVTLEEKGGSPVPHLDRMFVKGEVGS